MTGQTVPKDIKLVDTGNDTWLAADRRGSKFNGIIIDPIDKEVVSSLLRDNGSEFVRAWDVYAPQRGWQYLLVDIWKLASANRKCRGLDLGRLAIVADAFQVMHNRYQAELMAQADEVFPGRVFFIQGKHQAGRPRRLRDTDRDDVKIRDQHHSHYRHGRAAPDRLQYRGGNRQEDHEGFVQEGDGWLDTTRR